MVQAKPAVIHFSGFELGITQTMILQLGNVSTEVQRMHIIPPQTKYFNIKYKKNVSQLVNIFFVVRIQVLFVYLTRLSSKVSL